MSVVTADHPARSILWEGLEPTTIAPNGWCYWCRIAPAEVEDHLIPRSRGGGGGANLVPSCTPCNSRKRDRTPAEYGAYLLARASVAATTCPLCGAGPGDRCLNKKGQPTITAHRQRKEAAA